MSFDWSAALSDWLAEPHKFGDILGFKKLTPAHDEWINMFLRVPHGEIQVLQAHRNSYKTTCGLVSLTLLFMLYPEIRILVARKSDKLAAKIAIALQKIFTTNEIVKLFIFARFGITDVRTKEWSENKTVFAFKRKVTVDPSLTICGIAGSITGGHFDYIWCDDIVDRSDSESDAERAATKSFVNELENVIEPTGSQMVSGTPWHEEDAFSILPPAKKYPIRSIAIPNIDEAWIARKQSRMPAWKWAANYELEHIADTETIGAIPFIDAFTAEYFVAWIDPAFSNAKGSDRCAVAVVGFAKSPGREDLRIEFTGMQWEKSISHADVRRELVLFLDRFHPLDSCLESQLSDSTVSFIAPFKIEEQQLNLKIKNNWTWQHQSGNKHARIQTFVHGNKFRLNALKGTDPVFMKYVTGYHKNAAVKDPADAVAGAINLWQTSPSVAQYLRLLKMAQKALQGR